MTRSSGAASRAAAARTADGLLAQRATRLRERERGLHRLVTEYHHAAAQARNIHEDAQAHAAKITTDAQTRIVALHERAEKEASAFQDAADTAVRALIQLGEPRAAVASLTQLTAAQVRAIERTAPSTTNRHRPAAQQSDDHDTPSAQTAR